jgi:hypothetical protein
VTIAGAALAGLAVTVAVAGPGWQAEVAALMVMAWGLYMMHAALREFASELSVEARAMALSLHSLSFFMSQSAGQIAYGVGRLQPGKLPTMLTGGAIMVVFVLALARWRRPSQRRAGRRTGSAN